MNSAALFAKYGTCTLSAGKVLWTWQLIERLATTPRQGSLSDTALGDMNLRGPAFEGLGVSLAGGT